MQWLNNFSQLLRNKSDSPWGVAFLLCIGLGNKKTPPKAGFFVEHIQESVLVSTLKRRSALLTQVYNKAPNCDWSLCQTLWQLALCR